MNVLNETSGLDGRPLGSKRATALGPATRVAMAWKMGETRSFRDMPVSHSVNFALRRRILPWSRTLNNRSSGTMAVRCPMVPRGMVVGGIIEGLPLEGTVHFLVPRALSPVHFPLPGPAVPCNQ